MGTALETLHGQSDQPLVSIIVPVYNVEETLFSCLMSVVFQSLENTEVIVVNDASPDGSQKIIDEFVHQFPDKVHSVIHQTNKGLAQARKTGLEYATAPYVVFVDSDDFISGKYCEILFNEIHSRSLEVVYFPLFRCNDSNGFSEVLWPPKEESQEMLIKQGKAAFCSAIYQRDFLLRHQEVAFVNRWFEDAAATPVLISLTNRVGICKNKNLYYYRFGRDESICTQRMSEKKMLDMFAADDYGLEKIKNDFREAYAVRVVARSSGIMRNQVEIYDYAVKHLQHILMETKEYRESYYQKHKKEIDAAELLIQKNQIPKKVYINGFMREQIFDFQKYLYEAKQAYLFDPEIIILDDKTCDVSLLPMWLKNASSEDKGCYFAIRNIAEHGGIYISPAVKMTTSFNREAFSEAFFAPGNDTSVIPVAFGGIPCSQVFQRVLADLDKSESTWKRTSVMDSVAHTLIGECGVHLNGKEEYGLGGLHILAFLNIFYAASKKSYCSIDYSNLKNTGADVTILPIDLYQFVWKFTTAETNSNDAARAKRAENELNRIKNTKLYKVGKKLSRLVPDKIKRKIWK